MTSSWAPTPAAQMTMSAGSVEPSLSRTEPSRTSAIAVVVRTSTPRLCSCRRV